MSKVADKDAPFGTGGAHTAGPTPNDGQKFPDRSAHGLGGIKGGEAAKPGQLETDEDKSAKE